MTIGGVQRTRFFALTSGGAPEMLRDANDPAHVAADYRTLEHGSEHVHAAAMIKGPVVCGLPVEILRDLQSRRAQRLLESRWVVWVAARHADHPSAAGAVRHKVKGDRDGEFAYVRDACVERALTCRSRSMLPRMLTRTCFALPGRLQEHPNDYCVQLLHPVARLGAQGAALKAVF